MGVELSFGCTYISFVEVHVVLLILIGFDFGGLLGPLFRSTLSV